MDKLGTFEDVLKVIGFVLTLLLIIFHKPLKRIFVWRGDEDAATVSTHPGKVGYSSSAEEEIYLTGLLAGCTSVQEKLNRLVRVRSDPGDGSVTEPAAQAFTRSQQSVWIDAALFHMTFLRAGDVLPDGIRLNERLDLGENTAVWRGDTPTRRRVAVKMLRYTLSNDASVVRRFCAVETLLDKLGLPLYVAVSAIGCIDVEGGPPLPYAVMNHSDYRPLSLFVERESSNPDDLARKIIAVADALHVAHEKNIVFCDIKPSHLLVDGANYFALTDLTGAMELDAPNHGVRPAATLGFSAPEVLDRNAGVDRRADIFALARVVAYIYFGKRLPPPYSITNEELVGRLPCSYQMKIVLSKALNVNPKDRYVSMESFARALEEALSPEEHPAALLRVLQSEWSKAKPLIVHAIAGILLFMVLARPVLSMFALVHLSDFIPVAVFHGVIGSIVWGLLITLAFVISLIIRNKHGVQRRRELNAGVVKPGSHQRGGIMASWDAPIRRILRGPVQPAVFCAAAGLLGGLICALPSIAVTNVYTLTNLGWLTMIEVYGFAHRLRETIFGTQMFFAFPLTGTLTGCGVGLFLYYSYEHLLRLNPSGEGLALLPTKSTLRGHDAFVACLRLLCRPAHLWLLLPVAGASVAGFVLHAPRDGYIESYYGAQFAPYAVYIRALGEGFVHYLGAVGLTMGFFYRVPQTRAA